MSNHRSVGTAYEAIAADYLRKQGYHILEMNFHARRYGEIDVIAEDQEKTLVFCECKYRENMHYGDPLEAVGARKQRKICQSALYYLCKMDYGTDHPCRFDVIAIYGNGEIRHIRNAFEFQ